jgi:autotransporter-associated beta strand protein
LSTKFSGTILDSEDSPATGGSLTKVGRGTLTLSRANGYTGGTTISRGTLLVSNASGSATGTGTVQVTAGTLGGGGIVSGAVTIGTGNGVGAFLSPSTGSKRVVALTLDDSVTLKADSTYVFHVSTKTGQSDMTTAEGVTIESGAAFSLLELAHRALASGTVVTAISNSSATPIAGTFANLADGSTIMVGGNTYLADYQGGDGNDLTLTVVP